MKFSKAVKEIRKAKPVRNVLAYNDGKLDVTITSAELFSSINQDLPSGEIIDYLYEISSSSTEDLRIILPATSERERVRKVYLNYLSLAIKKDLREYRTIMIKIISFLVFGALVLTLSYILEGFNERIFYDTVNIIGGFAIWEAAEVFFFQRSEKKREMHMKLRLLKADWQ